MIKIDGKPFEIKYFPDGTLNMTDCYIPNPGNDEEAPEFVVLEWRFESIAEQVVLYNLTQYIQDQLGSEIILILPYVPNARMDRVKNPYKEVHTLKYFCKFINDLHFKRVFVTDVHSPVTMTLLNRCFEMNIEDEVTKVIELTEPDYIFFPDKGAYERYSYLHIRTPFFGEKDRDWATGRIRGVNIINPYNISPDDYAGKSILMVDDISSYGGTFFHAGKKLKELGFGDIYLYITHCENNILKGECLTSGVIKQVFTTDSIFTAEHPQITVLEAHT